MVADQDFGADLERERLQAFGRWLELPTTRFLVALIPQGAPPEAVKTLLEDCFGHGFTAGMVHLGVTVMNRHERKKERP